MTIEAEAEAHNAIRDAGVFHLGITLTWKTGYS